MKRLRPLLSLGKRQLKEPRALGVLLCYNDADILEDSIRHLLDNNHELIVWDHGSTDNTRLVLDKYEEFFVERKFIPREFDFYKLYQRMSQHLIDNYIKDFDWVSWPDQDEILEGPSRGKSYYDYITDVFRSKYNWIEFNNFNYWFTKDDDALIKSPVKRIRHYSIFPNCAPRIRSWRASVTNIREFNHNPLPGEKYPTRFNLCHYPMRSYDQMMKRIEKDRAGLRRGKKNVHYSNMKKVRDKLEIQASQLYYDDGGELDDSVKFDWDQIYFAQ
jgi:glycosyltransferase involved in cell wall biosynthesis